MDKLRNLLRAIKENGGILKSFDRLYVTDDLKWGCKVGKDKYGNVYYENRYFFYCRDRWVIFPREVHLNYDARLIPPEWHGWLHHTTDILPCNNPIISCPHRWDRWVIFPREVHLNYDARLIPPEWHGWLHHTTDILPCNNPIISCPHRWQLDRGINTTGTSEAYYPYNTVPEKIDVWKPKKTSC